MREIDCELRLIEQVRTIYRRDDLTGPLPLGSVEPLGLPFESYRLALTPRLVTQVYGSKVSDAMLAFEGRYVHSEGDVNWWMPSGQAFYSPNTDDTAAQELAFARTHFFLPPRFRDLLRRTFDAQHGDPGGIRLEYCSRGALVADGGHQQRPSPREQPRNLGGGDRRPELNPSGGDPLQSFQLGSVPVDDQPARGPSPRLDGSLGSLLGDSRPR